MRQGVRGLSRRGQGITEYVMMVTVILVAIIAGAVYVKNAVNQGIQDSSSTITAATGKIKSGLGLQ